MQNIDNVIGCDNLTLYSSCYPFSLSYRISSFESSSEEMRFIKNCERLIRISHEYKQWRTYLREVLELNSCFLTNESNDECTVEIHHHIPSLFMMVKAVINKSISLKEEFATFDICLKVMELHFKNQVGYVCLVKTLHEKFHNGFLQIPIELVQGNYKVFLDEYLGYLDPDDVKVIEERLSVKKTSENFPYIWNKNNYPNYLQES